MRVALLIGDVFFTKYREDIPSLSTILPFIMSAPPNQTQNTPVWFSNLVSRAERRTGLQRQGTLNEWFHRASAGGIDARVLSRGENQQSSASQTDVVMSPPAAPPGATSTNQVFCRMILL